MIVARRRDYDLTRYDDTERLFADARPELVFHLAAEVGGIGANRENPGRYWYANLMMGAHVLELSRAARRREARRRRHRLRVSEVHAGAVLTRTTSGTAIRRRRTRPYGVAKKSVLVGAQAYREQYGTNAIFLLPANLYGPRDNFDLQTSHVIPALIRKMLDATGEVVLWGDGSPTREFLYVEDCAEGLLLAAERYDEPAPVNLGTGVETSIRELAETIADVTGFTGELVWDTSMPNGQPRRQLDASRAEQLFGFRARTTLRDGLERTVAWYQAHAHAGAR